MKNNQTAVQSAPLIITFTGADDRTNVQDLFALARDYPSIEFGILFSPKRTGTPRYPTSEWLRNELLPEASNLNLSAHLCGDDSKEVLDTGKSTHDAMLAEYFDRVQLNTAREHIDADKIAEWALQNFITPILQCRGEFPDQKKLQWLYDVSGGEGITPQAWPEPIKNTLCGYAGGLRKENIASLVQLVGAKTDKYWLDMESGVRDSEGNFSVGMCREICEIVFDGKSTQ